LAITRYAGSNNRAWPAYETLAIDVNCSRRRVIDAVDLLQCCKLIEKRKRGNRSNAYLVYPPDYFSAESETQALIESRLRRGKGGREPKVKETAAVISAIADRVAEAPALYGLDDAADPGNGEEETGVHSVHHEVSTRSVSNIFLVNPVHPEEGELSSPSECSEFTPEVNSVHPKNNKKNNDLKISSQAGLNCLQEKGERDYTYLDLKEGGAPDPTGEAKLKNWGPANSPPVTVKQKAEGGLPGVDLQTTTDQQTEVLSDFDAIKNAFRRKGYRAADRLVSELLRGYELVAIVAAIEKTDFNLARNPPAVIKWMLSTGSYVVPIERKVQAPAPETRAPDPAEDAAIREMIKNTKAGLLAKTLQKAL
jgi:hypothetical protein